MGKGTASIAINRVSPGNYLPDCVSLPSHYGTVSWYRETTVKNIIAAVQENLETLDQMTGFTSSLIDREVILKPNLVTVYDRVGLARPVYPNTTDPRVIEATVLFLKKYQARITIAESSGRGLPTRSAFKLSGLDRLAARHQIRLIALEEEPVNLYSFPHGKVEKSFLLPAFLERILQGEALYFSLPKLKTNLYTGVSLGCKNSMGFFPYLFRQRNHNFNLPEKLADIHSFIPPDLIIIDGIVGGEEQSPGPVHPVDSRIIISGNQGPETDRVAARIMGFQPDEMQLFQALDRRFPPPPRVKTAGQAPVIPFRRANPSLHSKDFRRHFPRVLALIGHEREEEGLPMEMNCRGGCLATTRLGFEFFRFEGLPLNFPLTLIIGRGLFDGENRYFLDGEGTLYPLEKIQTLPRPVLVIGSCAVQTCGHFSSRSLEGCMIHPNSVHQSLHQLTGLRCRMLNPLAPAIVPFIKGRMSMQMRRFWHLGRGQHLDYSQYLPEINSDFSREPGQCFLKVPLDPMGWKQRLHLIARELFSQI